MQQFERLSVIVMCGGLATRMGGQPKYLLQVTDSEKVIDLSLKPAINPRRHPVTDHIILASGKHHTDVVNYQRELAPRISHIRVDISQSAPEGQFKAIAKAAHEYSITGPIATLYADEVVPGLSLDDVYDQHKNSGAQVTRVVTRISNDGSSKVFVGDDMRISPRPVPDSQQLFATGIMILEPDAQKMALGIKSPNEFLQRLINERKLLAYIHDRSFNVNTPSDLDTIRKEYRLGL